MMKNYIIYCIIAMAMAATFTVAITPMVRILAYKMRALDVPRDERRMHKKTTPLLGGLALWFGFTITSALFCAITRESTAMWIGGTLIVIVGLLDDRFDIKALPKLLLQIAITAGTVIFGNLVVEEINVLGIVIHFGHPLGIVLSVFWIVALINAINLIDGLDGLACGVSCIGCVAVLIISIIYSNTYIALFSTILIGACAGFLPYNSHPAKIFMGDTGSMFLGYILAMLSIQGSMKMNSLLALVTPVAVFGLPFLDTAFAFIRRIASGRSPFSADRGHLHHRLIDMGFSHKQTVFIMYIISAALGVAAVLLALRNKNAGLALLSKRRLVFCAAGIVVVGVIMFVTEFIIFHNTHIRRHSGLGLPREEKEQNKETENN